MAKTMKKTVLIIFLLSFFLTSSPAFSQPRHEKRLNRLTEKLSLNSDQQKNISGILEASGAACKGIRDPKEHRACRAAQKNQVRNAIKAELNSEQKAQFEEMKSRRGDRGRRERSPKGKRSR